MSICSICDMEASEAVTTYKTREQRLVDYISLRIPQRSCSNLRICIGIATGFMHDLSNVKKGNASLEAVDFVRSFLAEKPESLSGGSHDFEKNPCVNDEKSYSFADCVGGPADGIGDLDGIVRLFQRGAIC
ncbi:hypothetical protein LOK49_LG05G03731 [Camellia lanceoleosa]|uniref:Uncharacterized protein n=1 Tax=Camellia lanceoleosa TaxID=1840588 RepID=A0ACC0HR13_9ERIC|nr:hypothetical protein LOK49_LG05G03731 [Camellia lanceoleosa]